VSLRDSDDLECRFHVDGSVIESLVNRQVAWTKRFYYAGPAQTLRIQWKGKISPVSSLSVWPLSPISDDRLTT
jgi:beta-fructofuranosidase